MATFWSERMTELIIIFSIMGLIMLGMDCWLRKCSNWVNSLNKEKKE